MPNKAAAYSVCCGSSIAPFSLLHLSEEFKSAPVVSAAPSQFASTAPSTVTQPLGAAMPCPELRLERVCEDTTCGNWTSGGEGSMLLGHNNRGGGYDGESWVNAHTSNACSEDGAANSSVGLYYCFASAP